MRLYKKCVAVGVVLSLAAVCLGVAHEAQGADDTVSGKGSTSAETGLGNLVADAVRQLADCPVALLPGSSLRESNIKLSDLNAQSVAAALVDPDQPVAIVSLTGAQLRDALERSVSLAPKPNTGFLQISGISFGYSLSAPAGKRVADILLGRKAVKAGDDIRVAMPSELAKGGFGYFRVWGNLKAVNPSPGTVEDAIGAFLASKPDAATFLTGGRIRRLP
ncbi:MAG: 5'-nucleotidase C-terminal domain-containing protein [Armatimonadetes bacterium]|nr:5'-nucleotidase C-terminal domain-containing protein [Armatimonadota bacterium]